MFINSAHLLLLTHGGKLGKQSGVVLIYCLIILLLVGLLGLSSLNASITQERMANSFHHNNIAFQAAESAMIHLERKLLDFEHGDGIPLSVVQKNYQHNGLEFNQLISIADQTYILWQQGQVTKNAGYYKSSQHRDQWWREQGTPYNKLASGLDNTQHAGLSAKPRMMLEQGEFLADDLSMDSQAESRGRQVFHGLVRAEGLYPNTDSTLRTDVLVRYQ